MPIHPEPMIGLSIRFAVPAVVMDRKLWLKRLLNIFMRMLHQRRIQKGQVMSEMISIAHRYNPRPLPADLQAWLDAGEPPVYVGFGSMLGKGTDHVEKVVHAALTATGRRCLIGAGWAGLGTPGMPPDPDRWRVVGEVSHQTLFPRMAAVVHHGGSGTTANVLRAGVPQVVLPLILDQFHHAHRLWLTGLAPKTASMEKVTAQQLTLAIETAIAMPPGPRQEIAARLRSSDGVALVADVLQALAGRAAVD